MREPSQITKKTWRRVRWCSTLTGAWGVLTGYPLFVLISEKTKSPEGSAAILHFLVVLAVAVIVVAITEWLRDTIRGESHGRRSVSSLLISIVLLVVFELFVLAYEEISQVRFESPYVLGEIAERVSGHHTPYAFLKPADIKDPKGLLERLREGLKTEETASPEKWVVSRLPEETRWTFFPDIVPVPPDHSNRLTRLGSDWWKSRAFPFEEHDIWPTFLPSEAPPAPPAPGTAEPESRESAAPQTQTDTTNPLFSDNEVKDQAQTEPPGAVAPASNPPDEEYDALLRKVNTLSSTSSDVPPQFDLRGVYTPVVIDRTNEPYRLANKAGGELTIPDLQSLLAVELNRQILSSRFYEPDAFRFVKASAGVKETLTRELEAIKRDDDLKRSQEEAERDLKENGEDAAQAATEKNRIKQEIEHNDTLFLPLQRVIWLNRELLTAAFPGIIEPAQESGDRRTASLIALGMLWILAGGALGWTLAVAIQRTHEGWDHPVRRTSVRGIVAGVVGIPLAVIGYVLLIRTLSVVRDLWFLRGELSHLLSPAGASYDFGTSWLFPVAVRLALFRSHPWFVVAGLLVVAVALVLLWFLSLLFDIKRWQRFTIGGGGAIVLLVNALLFDLNLVFIFFLVGLVWAIPSIFLGASTPYLQTGSELPRDWGWIAMASGATLMLLTLLRLVWQEVPWWMAVVGILMFISGLLVRTGHKVEDFWPLAALVLGLVVYGATAIVQNATFYGVLADFHDLSVRDGNEVNLWARVRLPAFLGGSETTSLNPNGTQFSPYDLLMLNLSEPRFTGDAALDRLVDDLDQWHTARLKKEQIRTARELELSIVGSLGFWMTVGLLASWAIVKPPRRHT